MIQKSIIIIHSIILFFLVSLIIPHLSGFSVQAAPVPVLQSYTPLNGIITSAYYVDGYRFTAENDLYLTALGFYDHGLDGIGYHEIGLWNEAGTLLDSAYLTGVSSPLNGNYRYKNLDTPVLLSAGSDYYIATTIYGDFVYYQASNIIFDSRITYVDSYYILNSTSSIIFPTELAPEGNDYVMVNALIQNVPIPGAVWLLFTGIISVIGLRRKFKN